MFDIEKRSDGAILIRGRLDASQAARIQQFVAVTHEDTVIDFCELDYISSAGLGQIVALHQKLSKTGKALILKGMQPQIRYIFHLARLDKVLWIE